jgi:hypothetical protein
MNHLYLQLGRAIASQCPQGFQKARLDAAPDEGEATITCTMADGSETAPDLSEEAHDAIWAALQEIRDEMEKKENMLWRRCTVTLVAGGGFEMEVER